MEKIFVPDLHQRLDFLCSNHPEITSINKLSKALGVTRQAVTKWWDPPPEWNESKNKNRVPGHHLEKLGSVFGIDIDILTAADQKAFERRAYDLAHLHRWSNHRLHQNLAGAINELFVRNGVCRLLIGGPSGMGKSYFLKQYARNLRKSRSIIVVTIDDLMVLEYGALLAHIVRSLPKHPGRKQLIDLASEFDSMHRGVKPDSRIYNQLIAKLQQSLLTSLSILAEKGYTLFIALDDIQDRTKITSKSLDTFIQKNPSIRTIQLGTFRTPSISPRGYDYLVELQEVEPEEALNFFHSRLRAYGNEKLTNDKIEATLLETENTTALILDLSARLIGSMGPQHFAEILASKRKFATVLVNEFLIPHFIERLKLELNESDVDYGDVTQSLVRLALPRWITADLAQRLGCEDLFLVLKEREDWLIEIVRQEETIYVFHDLIRELLNKLGEKYKGLKSAHKIIADWARIRVDRSVSGNLDLILCYQYHLFLVNPQEAVKIFEEHQRIASDTENRTLSQALLVNVPSPKTLPESTYYWVLLREADLLRLYGDYENALTRFEKLLTNAFSLEPADYELQLSILINVGVLSIYQPEIEKIKLGIAYLKEAIELAEAQKIAWFRTISRVSLGVGYSNLCKKFKKSDARRRKVQAQSLASYRQANQIAQKELKAIGKKLVRARGRNRHHLKRLENRFTGVRGKINQNIAAMYLDAEKRSQIATNRIHYNLRAAAELYQKAGNEYWLTTVMLMIMESFPSRVENKADVFKRAHNTYVAHGHEYKAISARLSLSMCLLEDDRPAAIEAITGLLRDLGNHTDAVSQCRNLFIERWNTVVKDEACPLTNTSAVAVE